MAKAKPETGAEQRDQANKTERYMADYKRKSSQEIVDEAIRELADDLRRVVKRDTCAA